MCIMLRAWLEVAAGLAALIRCCLTARVHLAAAAAASATDAPATCACCPPAGLLPHITARVRWAWVLRLRAPQPPPTRAQSSPVMTPSTGRRPAAGAQVRQGVDERCAAAASLGRSSRAVCNPALLLLLFSRVMHCAGKFSNAHALHTLLSLPLDCVMLLHPATCCCAPSLRSLYH